MDGLIRAPIWRLVTKPGTALAFGKRIPQMRMAGVAQRDGQGTLGEVWDVPAVHSSSGAELEEIGRTPASEQIPGFGSHSVGETHRPTLGASAPPEKWSFRRPPLNWVSAQRKLGLKR